jgi:sugar phosphate isomerase/epimerase
MKLACSSTAFDSSLRSGELTQLEWIDLCAHELAADGVVLDVRHFPRFDTDYLAQIKKMATDLGLCIAALRSDAFFDEDQTHMQQHVEMALTLGAPILSAPLPPETATSWSDVLGRLSAATSLVKEHNVTLALRNAPHTFAATTLDMKRVSKEADSAWLRYGPDFSALDAASEPEALASKAVLVWHPLEGQDERETAGLLTRYLGFLALDEAQGLANVEMTKSALRRWRSALFDGVNRT